MSTNIKKTEKKGTLEVIKYLKDKGFDRIEKSRKKDHDLEAWKDGEMYPIEVKVRTTKKVSPSMTVSINELRILHSNPNSRIILVALDKKRELRDIKEYSFKDVKRVEIRNYRLYFKR